ncbi:sulfotransferase family protein [Maribacter sp. 2307UL18-2]|uniref:sulfotransferase family protein n=1 Tax=Maribacter sp. 2307UL18-2 TaxID=3386274 RepID=UPI0039BD0A17
MSTGHKYYKELEKPIIFIGNPRSGTSVISEIVMRHRHIGFASQFQNRYPNNRNLNYIRRLIDNRFWRIHGQKKQLNKVSFINRIVFRTSENYGMWREITESEIDFSRGFLLDTGASDESVAFLRSYFRDIVRKQGKRRLAFKTTGPSRIEFLLSIFPDAQFVRIHRKPIPTVSSLLKSSFWEPLGEKQLWWTGAYSDEEKHWAQANQNDPVAMTAFQIKKVADVTDYEIDKMKADVFDVHYQDFVQDSEDTIRKILEYTGLPEDKGCMSYFIKNKIYNRNKKDEEYFEAKDLETIKFINSKENPYLASHS